MFVTLLCRVYYSIFCKRPTASLSVCAGWIHAAVRRLARKPRRRRQIPARQRRRSDAFCSGNYIAYMTALLSLFSDAAYPKKQLMY